MSKTWIQAFGTFNRADNSGDFAAMQFVHKENLLTEYPDSSRVVAEGTFQAFFEMPDGTAVLRLLFDGQELSVFHAHSAAPMAESFGLGLRSGHSVPLTPGSPPDPNATYTLQARQKGSSIWQTLDVGLDRLDTGQVDLNQFPDAGVIEVRVLKTLEFVTEEFDRTEIEFGE